MASTVEKSVRAAHLLRTDIRAEMAKADLRKAENWLEIGKAVDRVRTMHRLTLKEFTDALSTKDNPRDERQVSRWIEGKERPQIDVIFAVPRFRCSLVIALAELAGDGVEVTTQITVKRPA